MNLFEVLRAHKELMVQIELNWQRTEFRYFRYDLILIIRVAVGLIGYFQSNNNLIVPARGPQR